MERGATAFVDATASSSVRSRPGSGRRGPRDSGARVVCEACRVAGILDEPFVGFLEEFLLPRPSCEVEAFICIELSQDCEVTFKNKKFVKVEFRCGSNHILVAGRRISPSSYRMFLVFGDALREWGPCSKTYSATPTVPIASVSSSSEVLLLRLRDTLPCWLLSDTRESAKLWLLGAHRRDDILRVRVHLVNSKFIFEVVFSPTCIANGDASRFLERYMEWRLSGVPSSALQKACEELRKFVNNKPRPLKFFPIKPLELFIWGEKELRTRKKKVAGSAAGGSAEQKVASAAGGSAEQKVASAAGTSAEQKVASAAGGSAEQKVASAAGGSAEQKVASAAGTSAEQKVASAASGSAEQKIASAAGTSAKQKVASAAGTSAKQKVASAAGTSAKQKVASAAGTSAKQKVASAAGTSAKPKVASAAGGSAEQKVASAAGGSAEQKVASAAGGSAEQKVASAAGTSAEQKVASAAGGSAEQKVASAAGGSAEQKVASAAGTSAEQKVASAAGTSAEQKVASAAGTSAEQKVASAAGTSAEQKVAERYIRERVLRFLKGTGIIEDITFNRRILFEVFAERRTIRIPRGVTVPDSQEYRCLIYTVLQELRDGGIGEEYLSKDHRPVTPQQLALLYIGTSIDGYGLDHSLVNDWIVFELCHEKYTGIASFFVCLAALRRDFSELSVFSTLLFIPGFLEICDEIRDLALLCSDTIGIEEVAEILDRRGMLFCAEAVFIPKFLDTPAFAGLYEALPGYAELCNNLLNEMGYNFVFGDALPNREELELMFEEINSLHRMENFSSYLQRTILYFLLSTENSASRRYFYESTAPLEAGIVKSVFSSDALVRKGYCMFHAIGFFRKFVTHDWLPSSYKSSLCSALGNAVVNGYKNLFRGEFPMVSEIFAVKEDQQMFPGFIASKFNKCDSVALCSGRCDEVEILHPDFVDSRELSMRVSNVQAVTAGLPGSIVASTSVMSALASTGYLR